MLVFGPKEIPRPRHNFMPQPTLEQPFMKRSWPAKQRYRVEVTCCVEKNMVNTKILHIHLYVFRLKTISKSKYVKPEINKHMCIYMFN